MKGLYSKKKSRLPEYILFGVLGAGLICLLVFGALYVDRISTRQNLELTRQAVRRAAVQCYANEGIYPPDLTYLQENYGLTVNTDKFYVEYDGFASNIMPTIEVYERY